jgi:hypothetical protein
LRDFTLALSLWARFRPFIHRNDKELHLMMKWFRAHTKQIMAFLVLVAMFSFVGGSALVSILQPNPSKEPFGFAFGKQFNQGEIGQAQQDISVLDRISGRSPELKAMYGEAWQFGRKDLLVHDWYLLAREAERAGIEVSDQEVDDQLKNLPADYLETLRVQYGITPAEVRHAVARQVAIEKNGRRVTSAAIPSENQVRNYVQHTEDKVKVRLAALDAEKFIDPKEPVSPADLQAQFDKHKDVDPAKSDDGFGYRYPRRVKLQYVVADIPSIAASVDLPLDAVKSAWKANKSKYKKVVYVDAPVTSAPTSGPTSQPDKPKPTPKSVEKSFSEARADVERDLRQKSAAQAADQAIRKIQSQLQRPWLDEKTDSKTGYKSIPAGAKEPGVMKAASDRYAAEFKIALDYGETPLLSKEQLAKQPKIGGTHLTSSASTAGGVAETVDIQDYAFRVPGFFERASESESLPSLQLFQVPDMPLTDSRRINASMQGGRQQIIEIPAQKIVLFRVVEAREAEAPKSVDEVRAAVEHDVRLIRAFAAIEPIAKEVWAASQRLGVEKAMELFTDLREKHGVSVGTPPPFARLARQEDPRTRNRMMPTEEPPLAPPSVALVGASKEFVDSAFEMTAEGWKPPKIETPATDRIKAATTRPALEPAPKVSLVSLPKQHEWFVVELAGREPVDQGQFDTKYRQMAFYELMNERNMVLRDQWYKPEHIEKRCEFRRIMREGERTPIEGVGSSGHHPPEPDF